MPLDVATRWNSTYDMLRFATKYKSALKVLLNEEDELNNHQLNDTEWNLAEELFDVLKVRNGSYYSSEFLKCLPSPIRSSERLLSMPLVILLMLQLLSLPWITYTSSFLLKLQLADFPIPLLLLSEPE